MTDSNARLRAARTGKQYVRTFLFSMRLGAPLSRLHVLTKFLGILVLSFVVIRVMDETNPDPWMAGLLFLFAIVVLVLGGVSRWLFRSYMVVVFPMFLFLFITWLVFTPEPGSRTFLRWPIYSGFVSLGVFSSGLAFLGTVVFHYLATRKIARGVLLGIVLAYLVARFTPDPGIVIATYPLGSPYSFIISDRNLTIAGTKVLGYASMVFLTLMLVMTTRDHEMAAALRQLRVPYLGRFFLSIVFRTLSLSLMDFETIRQAQVARGVLVSQTNILAALRNIALISVPLVATMLRRATEIGDALQARGFSLEKRGQELLEIIPFSWLDGVVLAGLTALAVGVLGYSFNLSHLLSMR